MDITISGIKQAIQNSLPLKFTTHSLSHDTMERLEKILELFLNELGEARIRNQLSYCMKELAENGRKANLKRLYFEEKGLSITNFNDYKFGMESFKTDVYGNLPAYVEKLKKKDLYTKIIFHAHSNFFSLSICNNTPIMGYELKRIEERIAHSHAFKTMEEAFASIMDTTEGAGLGVVILMLMLKKIGLNENAFTVQKDGEETVARILIPRSDILLENLEPLIGQIVNEITVLPQFPEHISSLQRLLSNPDSDFAQIARIVKTDPALTGDLLKLVNSAQYMLRNKITNVTEALKMVGFKGMQNLLYSYGSQKILSSKYGEMEKLWQHSYRTAFYGYHIAQSYNFRKVMDDIYVGSLLHDLGHVVVEFLHPDLLDNIKTFTVNRGISAEVFEKFSIGLQHAEIGARIAEHWQFPDHLIAAIRYHHEPESATEDMRELIYTVYLANSLCNLEEGTLFFEQMNPEVLTFMKIKSRENLDTLHNRLSEAFKLEK